MSYWMQFAGTALVGLAAMQVYGYFRKPKVEWVHLPTKNAEHSLLEVKIDPDARYSKAVLAQEIAEIKWMWLRGFGVPGLQLVLRRIPPVMRALELWGHEVEVQMAVIIYGANEGEVRRHEAWVMADSSSYEFKPAGWSSEYIERKMAKRSRKARKWARKNLGLVDNAG
mgnify:CR=1 FL=1